ncbi:MAG: PaaX family transcriptional regulator [Citricoccus sp.]|nr:PaaX family transcriptional regulator [Citricoccus sp. WCRC_4]
MATPAKTAGRVIPRHQTGVAPQRLLVVLMGDYWFGRPEPLPSSALVELLGLFGVTAGSARASIQRLAHRGFLVPSRNGRKTAYAVHAESRDALAEHVRRLFQAHHPRPWDETWTIVTYSVPDAESPDRRLLRERLRSLRFGHLNDGVWVRPGHHSSSVEHLLEELPEHLAPVVTCFEGATLPVSIPPDRLRGAFDADAMDQEYRRFTEHWNQRAAELADHWPAGDDALTLRTEVMSDWRSLIRRDPHLPEDMMPTPAPLQQAAEACALFYDRLGQSAELAVRRIVERHQPPLEPLVRHHTFADADALILEAAHDQRLRAGDPA